MELNRAFTTATLAYLILMIEAVPLPIRNSLMVLKHNSSSPQQNSSDHYNSDSVPSNSFDHLMKSANDAIFYLVQDSQQFQRTLVSNHFGQIDANNILLSFSNLDLDAVQCESYRLTDRIALHAATLKKFLQPMEEIASDLINNVRTQSLARDFSQLENAFRWLLVLFNKILANLLINTKIITSTTTTTAQEMRQLTTQYLVQNQPALKVSADQITAIRNFSFVKAIIKVASIIKSELQSTVL